MTTSYFEVIQEIPMFLFHPLAVLEDVEIEFKGNLHVD